MYYVLNYLCKLVGAIDNFYYLKSIKRGNNEQTINYGSG